MKTDSYYFYIYIWNCTHWWSLSPGFLPGKDPFPSEWRVPFSWSFKAAANNTLSNFFNRGYVFCILVFFGACFLYIKFLAGDIFHLALWISSSKLCWELLNAETLYLMVYFFLAAFKILPLSPTFASWYRSLQSFPM